MLRTRTRDRGLGLPPGGGEASALDLTASLPSGFTYTRNDTVATYRDSDGKLQKVTSANQPLFDHDEDGNPRGLRFDVTRTNKLTSANATITATGTYIIASGGTFSATTDSTALTAAGLDEVGNGNVYKIVNASGSDIAVYWAVTTGNTNKHCLSMWARTEHDVSGTDPYIMLTDFGGNNDGETTFFGTSYQRVISENITPTNSSQRMAMIVPTGRTVYFLLAQMEEGTYATDPIVTGDNAAATRAAPLLNAASPTFLDTANGGLVISYEDERRAEEDILATVFSFGEAGVNNRYAVFKDGSGNLLFRVTNGSTEYLDYDFSGEALVPGLNKIALAWKENNLAVAVNGIQVVRDTSATLPTIFTDGLSIGAFPGSVYPFRGWISSITGYVGRPTQAQLEAATDNTVAVTGTYDADLNMVFMAGQSNSVGVGTGTAPTYLTNTGRLKLLGNDGVLKNYADPYDSVTNAQFGNDWLYDSAAENSYAGKIIDDLHGIYGGTWCAVPANKGGTGILKSTGDDAWWTEESLGSGKTGISFTVYCALQRLKQAKALGTLKAIVWDQGATDGLNGVASADFEAASIRLMALFRKHGGNVPIARVIMQDKPVAAWVDIDWPSNDWAGIQQAQRDYTTSNTVLIESEPYELQADELHFTTAGYVDLGAAISEGLSGLLTDTRLRVIGANEQMWIAAEGRSGRNRQATRQAYIIGQDASSLVFSTSNWWMGSSQTDGSTQFEILKASLESSGGTMVPIYFNGSRNVVVAAGDNNIQSDPVLASSFSLSKFSRNEEYWVKMVISVPAATNAILYTTMAVADKTGGQSLWYDSATINLESAVDSSGTFSTTSTESRVQGHRLLMLGYPVTDSRSFITVGDSIAAGSGDSTANGAIGRGFVQRAMVEAGPTNAYPHLNFGRSGIAIGAFNSGAKWKVYIPYARHAIDQILTNDVSGSSAAQMQTAEGTLWGHLRDGGIEKIIRTELLVRTTSTDTWATTANQTINAGWENGGKVPTMNTWWPTKVSDNTIDYYVSGMRATVADATSTDKWAVPKTYNNDDVHPSTAGANILKPLLRTVLDDAGLA